MDVLSNHPRIEMIARISLKPNPHNARKHSAKQMEQLGHSLRRFGFKGALIVDDDNVIVAGNALWEAAGACGFQEVPVIRVRFLSEADRRAFAIAHNRLGDLSSFDETLLAAELEFLFEQEYDFTGTGFELGDLDFSIDAAPTPSEPPVELPDPLSAAVSRLGDLWLIGPHRLYCGNAREAESYDTLLGDALANMIFCDAPYNVSVTKHVSGLGKARHREFAEASGEMTALEFTAFLRSIFRNCARFSTDGSIHYQCMDWRHTREILDAADGVYAFKQLAVWAKTSAGMGSFYRSQHELVFIFKSGTARHVNNFGLGETGRHRSNLWTYSGANTFRKGRDQDLAAHPTVKNTAMVADAILDCSNRGDLILDPCSGSGTTIAAAHRTKRRAAAIEIDPLFVDTSLARLRVSTGFVPTLLDGRTFEEVAAERAIRESQDD